MSTHDEHSLGNLVVILGCCTEKQVAEGLAGMNEMMKLGEVLMNLGYLTKHQLELALTCQGVTQSQTSTSQIYAFVRHQHIQLMDDLRNITKEMRNLTAKLTTKANGRLRSRSPHPQSSLPAPDPSKQSHCPNAS